jgi:hypothetical protein
VELLGGHEVPEPREEEKIEERKAEMKEEE